MSERLACGCLKIDHAFVDKLIALWAHLGAAECLEQVEAHLESAGILEYGPIHYAEERVSELDRDKEDAAIAASLTWPGRTCSPACGHCGACT